MERVNCMKCKHYYVTYDPKIPRGCRFYRFTSAQLPSIVVKKETASDCVGFEVRKPQKKPGLDLNRDDLW